MMLGLCTLTRKVHDPKYGASVVWKAWHPLQQIVAVKLVKPDVAMGLQNRGDLSLQQEIRILRLLDKFGVIQGYFVEGECLQHPRYVSLKWLEGQTLGALLDTATRCPWDELRPTVRSVCSQLQRLHEANFVHRDIKPDNIMLTSGGATIFDYGLCVSTVPIRDLVNPVSAPLPPTSPGGSLRYCPPEQFDDTTMAGPATDVYSLGCTLYEALTGAPPYQGSDFMEIKAMHLAAKPAPIAGHLAIPDEVSRIVLACLEKDPTNRPDLAIVAAMCETGLWRQPKPPAGICRRFRLVATVISCRDPGPCPLRSLRTPPLGSLLSHLPAAHQTHSLLRRALPSPHRYVAVLPWLLEYQDLLR
jgi:serine/threonine protein kinase